jgi:hypothetical protein
MLYLHFHRFLSRKAVATRLVLFGHVVVPSFWRYRSKANLAPQLLSSKRIITVLMVLVY